MSFILSPSTEPLSHRKPVTTVKFSEAAMPRETTVETLGGGEFFLRR